MGCVREGAWQAPTWGVHHQDIGIVAGGILTDGIDRSCPSLLPTDGLGVEKVLCLGAHPVDFESCSPRDC